MKYPQLVSTRAVSAISDWLVTQLEQLGVDASSVYSRLLLSLLHTPLQINALDLAELSDHKVLAIGRSKSFSHKSGNNKSYRRFSAADTEALKRLAAIDSLLEAVPSDQHLSKIETLIDELSSKLRAIEEQNALDDATVDITDPDESVPSEAQSNSLKKKSATPEDPAKRYFRAFPALSGQSSHDFKKASWPRTDVASATQEQTQASQRSTDPEAAANCSMDTVNVQKKKPKRKRSTGTDSTMASASVTVAAATTSAVAAASNNCKTNVKAAKASIQGKNANVNVMANATVVNGSSRAVKSHSKKKSADMWDTNFDGQWEMGRDLFREFVLKENKRNRSISENDTVPITSLDETSGNACAATTDGMTTMDNGCEPSVVVVPCDADEENLRRTAAAAAAALFGEHIDIDGYAMHLPGTFSSTSTVTDSSFLGTGHMDKMVIRSEGYSTPDTLASWNEQETNVYSLASRRLYERDVSTESINCMGMAKATIDVEYGSDCVDSGCDESLHLAAFEAKFDQNVEALWNDCKSDEPIAMNVNDAQQPMHSIWFNYYRNAIDNQPSQVYANEKLAKFTAMSQMAVASLNRYTEDSARTAFYEEAKVATKPSGLGLTASIWTDTPNNQEDDDSFYANARLWEKNHKTLGQSINFSTIDSEPMAGSNASNRSDGGLGAIAPVTTSDIGNYENATLFKWSDGVSDMSFAPIQADTSNAGPSMKKESKIRKNLFGPSYFEPNQSQQAMAANTSGLAMAVSHDEPHSTTEYAFGHTQENITERVTLSNHSSGSCFREVEPLSYEAKQEIKRNNNSRKYLAAVATQDALSESEDLLTSDRTRFRPIRQTYVDGFTFKINSDLEKINYERSASGSMYCDSEVYREYYSYDEEENGGSRGGGGDDTTSSLAGSDFVLKYAIRQNDMACQTDDTPPKAFGAPSLLQAARLQSYGALSSLGQRMINFNSGVANQPQFVCMQRTADDNDLDNDSMDQMIDINDCYANLKGWSMVDGNRCCNNNNNAHALWEHCSTCSNDMISVPANRLLKDELSADGDEIMSDLKFLQNLYIGSDWEDGEDTEMIVEYDDDTENRAFTQHNKAKHKATDHAMPAMVEDSIASDDLANDPIYSNVNKLISDLLQPEKAQNLVQAIGEQCQLGREHANDSITQPNNSNTKDIDPTKSGAQCNNESTTSTTTASNQNQKHFGSLWVYNDNSIWHKDRSVTTDDVWSNALYTDKSVEHSVEQLATKMPDQWEYANLEKIWNSEALSNADYPDANCSEHASTGSVVDTSTDCGSDGFKPIENPNALDKFMELIKQANASGQYGSGAQQHHQCTNEELLTNLPSRTDRKRRHSATSRNCFDQFNYPLASCEAIDTTKKLATKTVNEFDERNIFDCSDHKKTTTTANTTTTAIITCKYWSANDSFCLTSTLAFNNNNINANDEHFLNCYHKQFERQPSMKYEADDMFDTLNSSDPLTMYPFLKQVAAMVSRPLTR